MKNNDIIGFDFQGWPVEKLSLESILERLGATYNKETGNYEIPKDELQVIPKVYTDDGMGYGAMGWFVTDIDYSDNDICNIWIDSEDININTYLEDGTQPGMTVTDMNGNRYSLETFVGQTGKYRLRKIDTDNSNSYTEFVDRSEVLDWIKQNGENVTKK